MADTMTEAREARKARLIAARADRPATVEVTVPLTDVIPGDFIVSIPAQGDLRRVLVNATVFDTVETWDEWGQRNYRGRLQPVQGRRFAMSTGVTVSRPAAFTAVVRRVAS